MGKKGRAKSRTRKTRSTDHSRDTVPQLQNAAGKEEVAGRRKDSAKQEYDPAKDTTVVRVEKGYSAMEGTRSHPYYRFADYHICDITLEPVRFLKKERKADPIRVAVRGRVECGRQVGEDSVHRCKSGACGRTVSIEIHPDRNDEKIVNRVGAWIERQIRCRRIEARLRVYESREES